MQRPDRSFTAINFSQSRGDLSGQCLKRKTAGRDTPAVGNKSKRRESFLRFTVRRRAQYKFGRYSDRFHLHVPPFLKEFDYDSVSLSFEVGSVKEDRGEFFPLPCIFGSFNSLDFHSWPLCFTSASSGNIFLNEKAYAVSPCSRKYSSRSLPSCGSGKYPAGTHHKA